MAEIRFEQVAKKFGTTTVIEPLDLVINEGEFFTFVGPSGCGKSTILNMIAGLEPVTSGKLWFDGALVNDLSPRDRDVAMVFQSYALYPHLSVFENLAFPLRMKREQKDIVESEVRRVAGLLGLSDLLLRKPRELSGGQRQRVALGRAMIRKPKVFLMDEPLSNLDARLRISMRAELKRLHQQLGITTIYVTHDQGEAMGLSERIAVLDKGAIQQCAGPDAVYRNPANMFVAGFIGSPPMNFIPCMIRDGLTTETDCQGSVISLPDTARVTSNEIMMGIRPEDVVIERKKREGAAEVAVSVIEPAGSFNWVEVFWRESKVRGMSKPGEKLQPGEKVHLWYSREKALLFDAKSGYKL